MILEWTTNYKKKIKNSLFQSKSIKQIYYWTVVYQYKIHTLSNSAYENIFNSFIYKLVCSKFQSKYIGIQFIFVLYIQFNIAFEHFIYTFHLYWINIRRYTTYVIYFLHIKFKVVWHSILFYNTHNIKQIIVVLIILFRRH